MNTIDDESTYESFIAGWSFTGDDAGMPVVWDVRTQTDGRVTAKIEYDGEAGLYTFVQDDGRWLIDDINSTAIIEPAPQS